MNRKWAAFGLVLVMSVMWGCGKSDSDATTDVQPQDVAVDTPPVEPAPAPEVVPAPQPVTPPAPQSEAVSPAPEAPVAEPPAAEPPAPQPGPTATAPQEPVAQDNKGTVAEAPRVLVNGEEAGRLYEKSAGFSYDPPKGWTIGHMPGMSYQVSHAQPVDDFARNIVVVDEAYIGSLDDYADANLKTLKSMLQDLNVLEREAFVTSRGLEGVKLVTENVQYQMKLRQTFYMFANEGMKFVVTCTSKAGDGDKYDAEFDAAMKTFRFHK